MLTSYSNKSADLAQKASDAEVEGLMAFGEGLTAEANPYREMTGLWFSWRAGFERAQDWAAAKAKAAQVEAA